AWRHHLTKVWKDRKVEIAADKDPASMILVPDDALYYAAQGCVEVGRGEPQSSGVYQGIEKLQWWIEHGQHEEKKKLGRGGLWKDPEELESFKARYAAGNGNGNGENNGNGHANGNGYHSATGAELTSKIGELGRVLVGCDFGSTTAKAVCLSPDKELLYSCYALSRGNPIEDAKVLFRQVREAIGD